MTTRTRTFALVAAIFLVVAIFAIPNLLSTTFVKQRVADQLSQLTGRQVALEGDSSISLRPYLGVSYDNVTISDAADAEGKPLIAIDELKAKLGLFAALFGDAELTEIELIRPHFHLRIDQNGHRNWLPEHGQMGAHIADPELGDRLRLGRLRIEDGILELINERDRQTRDLTAINGQFVWLNIADAANAQVSAVWRGEIMEINASFAEPLNLLRNGKSEISIKLDSKPLNLSFDGMAEGANDRFDGALSISSPSPKRLADWIGSQLPAFQKLGETSVSGDVVLEGANLEFPEANIGLEGHEGTGRLQLALREDGLFAVNGTLAFDTIALPQIDQLLQGPTAASTDENTTSKFDLSFVEGLALDVRLSANSASGTPFPVANLAAAAIINDGRASFDIGQAESLGGTISGSINLQSQEDAIALSANLVATAIDLSELTQVYKDTGFSLEGSGDVTINLKSIGQDAAGLMRRLNGEGQMRAIDGTLIGLDLPDLFEESNAGSDAVIRVSSGSTDYSELNLGYFIANGTAFLRDSNLLADAIDVLLKGRVDLVRSTLALRGMIKNSAGETSEMQDLQFFVGGTAASPLFVPLPMTKRSTEPPQQEEKAAADQ
ncbi:MAG: AsmA family protein [Hyphomicrobiales bacterium]|nr:AsmA family protein [Hyphomicrobiales bacterium]